ncbi:hypothetical protein C2I36_07215, partial [Rhodobacteraceae bacterium WD3A24]
MLKNLGISTKVHVLGGGLVLLLAVGGATGVLTLRHAAGLFSDYRAQAEQEMLIAGLAEDFLELRVAERRYLDAPGPARADGIRATLEDILAISGDDPRLRDAATRDGVMAAQTRARAYADTFERAVRADPPRREGIIRDELTPLGEDAAEGLVALHGTALDRLAGQGTASLQEMERIQIAILVATLVGVLAGLGFALWMAGALSHPVVRLRESVARVAGRDARFTIPDTERRDEVGQIARELSSFREGLARADREARERRIADEAAREQEEARHQRDATMTRTLRGVLHKLAEGDLTVRLPALDAGTVPEEYGAIRGDFNQAVARVDEVISDLRDSARAVQNGADEIRHSAETLSGRTESQASTLEEFAAALDELTTSVKSSADHVAEAEKTVSENREQAERAGEVVREAVSAMNEIATSSEQITRIIGVIDDIAFQTNLLALNAGVEAARAGEAGKGFAVVASEVRTLAQRASESAREIKQLISASSDKVDQGVDLVGRTGTALEAIVDRVKRVSDLVSDVARSAGEQAASLGEINDGINQFDKATQQDAAQVEETSAASTSMEAEARRLLDHVGKFRTGRAGTSARTTPAGAPARESRADGAAPRSTRAPAAASAGKMPAG